MQRQQGFSLVEALAALAVVAIAAASVPSLRDFVERQRANATLLRLDSQVASARMVAISHGRDAVACPYASPTACRNDGDWSQGWLVFLDADGNRRPDAAGDVQHVQQAPAGGRLRILTSGGRRHLRFLPDGRSPGSNLSFRLCSPDQSLLGKLIVNNAGRSRIERPAGRMPCDT